MYKLENGKYVEIQPGELEELTAGIPSTAASMTNEDALNEFISTLASSDTNSIAKIRAAAQTFLDNTQ